jgi:hypothetical protein
MSDESIAECEAICRAEFGVSATHPDLVVVCEDCYNDTSFQDHPFAKPLNPKECD